MTNRLAPTLVDQGCAGGKRVSDPDFLVHAARLGLLSSTGLFSLGATFTGSGELAQVGGALSVVNALVNLRDAFDRGDVSGGLYNSAVLGQSVLRLYTCDGLTGCANDLDWRICA